MSRALGASRARILTAAAALALSALALAGCSTSGEQPDSADAGYVTPGKLTIATGQTAYEPYVINDDPASGEGFEAALAYAIADKLGFAADDVEWVRTSFEAAIAPVEHGHAPRATDAAQVSGKLHAQVSRTLKGLSNFGG